MKSSPLLNGRTANPPEASKRPVDLSAMGSSSTRQTTCGEGFSPGFMRICAATPFSMWDVAIIPQHYPRQVGRVVDLSLMDFSLMQGWPARGGGAVKCEPSQARK